MGKKRIRKTKVSKGDRRNVAVKVLRTETQKIMAKVDARSKGKTVRNTIPNPDKSQTNKRFIRV